MKDQYFGDINDYRKYGLLRAIIQASGLRVLVAWMLTPDDRSTDGNFVTYLRQPGRWASHDPDLFHGLKDLLDAGRGRQVHLIEESTLLPNVDYFSSHVPDKALDRSAWFGQLVRHAEGCDLVFLDPDNGLEVKSKPYGGSASSKYLYWREVESLWASGKSLLIYQHFTREKRHGFIQRMTEMLRQAAHNSLVEAFSTPHVVFLMALQPRHRAFHEGIVGLVEKDWKGQIYHWNISLRY